MGKRVLERDFYARDPKIVAQALLGCTLVSTIGGKRAAGTIVETEAYLAKSDPACHGSKGKTPSNSTMFETAGLAYVYPIHAKFCFNVVTESVNLPSAVLIRAIRPIEGIRKMAERRGTDQVKNLCSGPGKLCQALNINRDCDGNDLTKRRLIWIEESNFQIDAVKETVRIGVTSAESLQLRFVIRDNEFASGPRYLR